jgi:hypothetical protein
MEYFEISGIFLQLIWRILTILTEHFDVSRIFQRFSVLMLRSFPTIFRQLSDRNLKSKAAVLGLDPPTFRITTLYSTTAPHSLYVSESLSAISYPSPVNALLCQHCVNCVYLRQCCVFLRQYSVHLRQYCVFLHQYCVFLRQYSVHPPRSVNTVFFFVSTVFYFVSTQFTFVNTVFFFVSIVLSFVSTVFFSLVLC